MITLNNFQLKDGISLPGNLTKFQIELVISWQVEDNNSLIHLNLNLMGDERSYFSTDGLVNPVFNLSYQSQAAEDPVLMPDIYDGILRLKPGFGGVRKISLSENIVVSNVRFNENGTQSAPDNVMTILGRKLGKIPQFDEPYFLLKIFKVIENNTPIIQQATNARVKAY